jgi:hypothetical protein
MMDNGVYFIIYCRLGVVRRAPFALWTDGRDSTLRLTSNINFLLSGIGSLTEETLP